MPLQWEYLGKASLPPGMVAPNTVETWRTKVPGGWLVVTKLIATETSGGVTFYPDPQYEWDGNSLP